MCSVTLYTYELLNFLMEQSRLIEIGIYITLLEYVFKSEKNT